MRKNDVKNRKRIEDYRKDSIKKDLKKETRSGITKIYINIKNKNKNY